SAASTLSDEYLRELWKSSPMAASQVGYHKDNVDHHLDDLSSGARARRLAFLKDFSGKLTNVGSGLSPEDDADIALLTDAVRLERLELEEAHDYARRCDKPLDDLGGAFFTLAARDYAPLDDRAQSAIARLREVPRYLTQAQASIDRYVDVFAAAAKD